MNRVQHSVVTMCRVLEVSPSGYYAWRNRQPSDRQVTDAVLTERIRAIHRRSRGSYGAPRIHEELKADGWRVSAKRVARLMREAKLRGVPEKRFVVTTRRTASARHYPDLVERQFRAERPDALYCADITYIPTWAGYLYLAVVLDVFSRRVVGWSMAAHLRTELVLAALEMALGQRKPQGVIHHSDPGTQYTSIAFGERCRAAGVRPSMATAGDCYDNSLVESFFATLKRELLGGRQFRDHDEARDKLFEYIEGWYNPHRRHSSIRYLSPMHYEREHLQGSRPQP